MNSEHINNPGDILLNLALDLYSQVYPPHTGIEVSNNTSSPENLNAIKEDQYTQPDNV